MVSTKTYFQLLQAIHHVEILDEAAHRGSPPPGMARKAQFLTSFIKPAAPNSHTLNLVTENTKMWMQRNLEILKIHYTDLLRDLSVGLPPFRPDAFDRAINWARKRYHNKLTPSSISALHSLLSPSDPLPSTPPLDIANPILFPPLPRPQRLHRLPSVPPRLPNTLTLPSGIPCLLSLSFPHRPPYHRPPPRPLGKDAPPRTSGRTRPYPPPLLPISSVPTPPPTSGPDLFSPNPPASPLPTDIICPPISTTCLLPLITAPTSFINPAPDPPTLTPPPGFLQFPSPAVGPLTTTTPQLVHPARITVADVHQLPLIPPSPDPLLPQLATTLRISNSQPTPELSISPVSPPSPPPSLPSPSPLCHHPLPHLPTHLPLHFPGT
ncbi:Titin [Dissostichus eleginoides]|uniref:Titin n=1 Tax=Dissostichus eleginoides TaxID=100907 RepID=A0AAD9B3U7_DISEL|nr:Titin [Dissostichus eleginoides]